MSAVATAPVPPATRALTELDRVDYCDAFTANVSSERSPEAWMRILLEDASPEMRLLLVSAFKAFAFGPATGHRNDLILGWRVMSSTADHATLGLDSPIGTKVRYIAQASSGSLVITTLVRLDTAAARASWAFATPIHRIVNRRLLARATSRAA